MRYFVYIIIFNKIDAIAKLQTTNTTLIWIFCKSIWMKRATPLPVLWNFSHLICERCLLGICKLFWIMNFSFLKVNIMPNFYLWMALALACLTVIRAKPRSLPICYFFWYPSLANCLKHCFFKFFFLPVLKRWFKLEYLKAILIDYTCKDFIKNISMKIFLFLPKYIIFH